MSEMVAPTNDMAWYSVRCIFHWPEDGSYEERVTLWLAVGFDDAIAKAEREAREYGRERGGRSITTLPLSQAFRIYDDLKEGAEVFSLLRDSDLAPNEYLGRFFATGRERGS